jgi:hypothetical protein
LSSAPLASHPPVPASRNAEEEYREQVLTPRIPADLIVKNPVGIRHPTRGSEQAAVGDGMPERTTARGLDAAGDAALLHASLLQVLP